MKKVDVVKLLGVLTNLAVLGGLVVLALETRQNTVQLRAAASYSITEALNNLNSGIYNDAAFADVAVRGEQDLSSLTPSERAQFAAFQFDRLNLAIHIEILEADGVSDIQFPYLEFLTQEFHSKPGLQQFLVSIEDVWVGFPELYDRLLLNRQ